MEPEKQVSAENSAEDIIPQIHGQKPVNHKANSDAPKEKSKKAVASFTRNCVVIYDEADSNRIFNKGNFGAIIEKKLTLSLVEALFLVEKGDISVKDGKKTLKINDYVKKATEKDKRFWTRYCVYSDIRKRGYVTKTALKYGADFRVYERGKKPGEAHAKWVLYAVNESERFTWRGFASMMRVAHSVRKTLLIGVVDDEGDVTYYNTNWTRPSVFFRREVSEP